MRYAIVDIETTGSYQRQHAITEIAILIHDGKKIVDSFETLINPETSIAPFVSRMTGITNQMLNNAPKFHEVAKQIWTMTDDAVFVAHSVNFDFSFIREEFKSLGADYKRKKLCTVRLSRKIFPGYSSYSLGNICGHLGIDISNRHRAMGDAAATAYLFDLCLQYDKEDVIKKSLNKNSREALLPPHLPKEVFETLPEKTGVYYFHDEHGKIIYVGKAIDIKSRIYSHLTGKGSAKLPFLTAIANITYTLCGTELIALLLESHEIKRLFPLYNQAQKFNRGNYVLVDYFDMEGIHHLMYAKTHPSLQPLSTFKSFEAAREFMSSFTSTYNLCPKYCGIRTCNGPCFDYQLKKCSGVCAGVEDVDEYNDRVSIAIQSLSKNLATKMIVDEGRTWNEKSVVLIENGIYKGFGYFDSGVKINTIEEARNIIQPYKHNADVQRILNVSVTQ